MALIGSIVEGGARLIDQGGEWLFRLQTGDIRHYTLVMFVGAIVMVTYFILR